MVGMLSYVTTPMYEIVRLMILMVEQSVYKIKCIYET